MKFLPHSVHVATVNYGLRALCGLAPKSVGRLYVQSLLSSNQRASDPVLGFTRIGEEERRDGEAIALHKTHIWANSLKPVCFLCFLLLWCPLLPFIETGTLKIYTKMVLYMKNELLTSNTPHGV